MVRTKVKRRQKCYQRGCQFLGNNERPVGKQTIGNIFKYNTI